ncbi:MAG TPA: DUF507 family protein [Nitrospiria bacterium]|nr:DUF507 family protein [Nitrospiria bacterium]
MLLSDDKISHLSHLILKSLTGSPQVSCLIPEEKILREIKRAMTRELRIEEDIDRFVRNKLASYSRPLAEGSPEWNVLYHKFFEEETKKKNR